ncbi:hypothetical protein CGSMWGv1500E_05706 [Gardnerella vaginalis 1500E]|uniref:Uncharacterized protein n=1 Tax=Gardnerella vaginalis 1500E TaxID=698957 RepID=I4LY05_GARVA|nr:hypothetical protein [Gardnerella vaginalis]EIK81845.1 hypothetical protein CGSMWGv1500E_05706 [Gardnerella vaginalis 1500E]
MKKYYSKTLAFVLSGLCVFSCAQTASAGELKLWEHEYFEGNYAAFSNCDVDFQDNVYDSGKQNLVRWVSIWDSQLFGDRRIAKILKNRSVKSFNVINAADHASCFGGD